MDKYIPLLLQEADLYQSELFIRLMRMWKICQNTLMNSLMLKYANETLTYEEDIFLINMTIYKFIFLHKYEMLSLEQVVMCNFINFNFILESKLNF
jgi:hypothetical protein